MITVRVLSLTVLLITIIQTNTISYNRQLTDVYKHHRNNFHPLYHTGVTEPEECREEQQRDHEIVPRPPDTLTDLALNDDFNELWTENISNDPTKRGNLKFSNNNDETLATPTDSQCSKYWITSFKKNNEYSGSPPWDGQLFNSEGVCSCGIKWKIENLGPDHYPRYIAKASCEAPCWPPPSTCRNKYIKIHVLKKKHTTNIDKHAPLLPKDLREDYEFESITMPIDCECVLDV